MACARLTCACSITSLMSSSLTSAKESDEGVTGVILEAVGSDESALVNEGACECWRFFQGSSVRSDTIYGLSSQEVRLTCLIIIATNRQGEVQCMLCAGECRQIKLTAAWRIHNLLYSGRGLSCSRPRTRIARSKLLRGVLSGHPAGVLRLCLTEDYIRVADG